jgi:DNA polymerase III alpha subunit
MFLALIRPAKKHLIGKKWSEIARSVWDKDGDGDYAFRHSHSVAYAQLVVVHMNLLASGVKAYYD